MPTIGFTDAEHAAVTALIKRVIEEDRFPRAPRLDLLRAALASSTRQPRHGGRRRPKTPTAHAPPDGDGAVCERQRGRELLRLLRDKGSLTSVPVAAYEWPWPAFA